MPKKETSYSFVTLPSKGECYPHHKGKVRITPMRAIDENILADKKLREEGKAVDTLLRKLILDKDFNVDELCVEDRNAILMWILKDGYGSKQINPMDGKEIDLEMLQYSDFMLKGDENGWFEYKKEGQPIIKFRAIRRDDEKATYKMMEGIIEEDFRVPLRKAEKYLLKRITMAVDGNTKAFNIGMYIENLTQIDRAEYIYFINDSFPNIDDKDIDFEVLLLSKINIGLESEV